MAELDTSGGGDKGKKVRSKKQSTKVDLTAMVDLAFLLITFFMLTTSLSKPLAMDIAKPDKDAKDENKLELRASQTMTILLGKDNKVAWYMGEAGKSTPTIEGFRDLRTSLLKNKQLVKDTFGGKDIIVIIKPAKGSTYKNFVDVMDELNITKTNISAPAIDDDPSHLLDSEIQAMKLGGIY
ncbi:MAG: biopolymer transporter ExbD [Pedobacter sp.]|uniref:Biopolymer transporter ExbD n=1 Tax=Pedobacter cryotolerans TaxID=2571270 RepID=A0A4U1CD98_9SPHI|nr:biopolymer transporter ExbD [Pedobacter cryotolerans]RZL53309.1 MAG: biopolymer transporter ExbD [Pedobacter sp.]TKC01954.1 biopolymer transporter ExbD [Pedobacter cryotolerans]